MSSLRIDGEPAFVLHTRAYRETSQLVDILTRHHGRLRVVARGSRRKKTGGRLLEPFVPFIISWTGRGDLKTLVSAEASGRPLILSGDRLFSGFYLNELLLRLLAEHDPHESLFDHYLEAVCGLADSESIEPLLRQFEMSLLGELGYGLLLSQTADGDTHLVPDYWYWFDPATGIVEKPYTERDKSLPNWFSGRDLLAVEAGDYTAPDVARAAKRLMRLAMQYLLGDKPLSSRALFSQGSTR